MAPIALFFAMLWLTIFGIFGKLKVGALSLIPIIFILSILLFLINKDLYKLKQLKELVDFPVLVFVVITFWSYFNTQDMQFTEWDEFTQWGVAPKALYLFNSLAPDSPVQMDNPGYTPGIATLSYSILQIVGSWDESVVFWTYHLIFFVICISLIARFNFKRIWHALFCFVILMVSAVPFFDFFQTTYADPILSIVFGYSLYLAFDKSIFKNHSLIFGFTLTIISLFLIKPIGVVLGGISIMIFIANYILQVDFKNLLPRKIIAHLSAIAFPFLGIYLVRTLWLTYVAGNSFSEGLSGTTTESVSTVNSFFGSDSIFKSEIWKSYVERISNLPITPWNGIDLTTSKWLIIIFVLLVLNALENKVDQVRNLLNAVLVLLGAFLYLGVIFIAYTTGFGPTGPSFPSFARYASTYTSGALFFIVCVAVEKMSSLTEDNSESKFLKVPLIAISVTVILLFTSVPGRIPQYISRPATYSTELRSQFDVIQEKIKLAQFSPEDTIYVITQHKMGFEYFYLKYESLPGDVVSMPFSIGSDKDEYDFWTDQRMTLDAWNQTLNDFDFVIIYNISESFIKEYSAIFQNPKLIEEQTIYFVQHSDSGNKLVKFI